MSKNENLFTIPNFLSAYRLLAFPVLIWTILTSYESLFVILICANLISDILDGAIARGFNMQTEIGAKLDSIADDGTYIAATWGLFHFKWDVLEPVVLPMYIFIGMFLLTIIVALFKFRRMPSLHLYSFKIGGYIQGIFFFVTFVFDFYLPLYYFAMIWGIVACVEHVLVQLVLKEMKSNSKGLYWVLKNRS